MKTVARCQSLQEADRVRIELNAAGIECFIPDETVAATHPFHFFTNEGVRVQVGDEDQKAALEVLNSPEPNEPGK